MHLSYHGIDLFMTFTTFTLTRSHMLPLSPPRIFMGCHSPVRLADLLSGTLLYHFSVFSTIRTFIQHKHVQFISPCDVLIQSLLLQLHDLW